MLINETLGFSPMQDADEALPWGCNSVLAGGYLPYLPAFRTYLFIDGVLKSLWLLFFHLIDI